MEVGRLRRAMVEEVGGGEKGGSMAGSMGL